MNTTNLLLLFTALVFPFLFFTIYLRLIKKRTQEIIKSLSKNIIEKYIDAEVCFKGFDISKKKKTYKIDSLKTLYNFNLADLYLLNDGLIIVGKIKLFGKKKLLPPFAICWTNKISEPTSVTYSTKQINTELIGSNLEIQFEDPQYSNKIKLVIKKIGQPIYIEIQSIQNATHPF